MTYNIFAATAPLYWDKGMSVIPLIARSKLAFLKNWSQYSKFLPSPEEQELWIEAYASGNIGLVLGEQSRVIIIDYDYNNDVIEKAIDKVLPKTPWKRIGKKGYGKAFKYNGEITTNLYDENGVMVVQLLSTGAQLVLPPSIHPDTGRPYYEVNNTNLYDVVDELPTLPSDIIPKIISACSPYMKIKSSGRKGNKHGKFLEATSVGARDTQMTSRAGTLAWAVLRSELSLKQAMKTLLVWYEECTEKKENDPLDINKGLGKIVEFLKKNVAEGKNLPVGWDSELTGEEREAWDLNFEEEDEEWEFERILQHVKDTKDTTAEDSLERLQSQMKVCKKISRHKNLNSIEVDKILNTMIKGERNTKLGALKEHIKKLKSEKTIEGRSHHEIAEKVAEEFKTYNGGSIAYYNKEFWSYCGSHWVSMEDHELRSFIARHYGNYEISKTYNQYMQVLNCVRDVVPQSLKPDVDVAGVNFLNGFLNREGELVNHMEEQGMTYVLPFSYRPELAGKCPRFFKYLEDVWGNDPDYTQKVTAIREALCTTLFGVAVKFQRVFLLYGQANSGKSVLINIVSSIVPSDAYCAISPYQWNTAENRFMLAQFSGKLLNIAGELEKSKNIPARTFKEITVGDEVTVENKNGHPFKMRAKCAHWFAGNHLPKSNDPTNGFNRRWLIFEFGKSIRPEDVIVGLEDLIVEEELEAIVAWAVEIWPELKDRNCYTLPESHERVLEEMALNNSDTRAWMKSRLVQDPHVQTESKDLYNDYWKYCQANLIKALPSKLFFTEFNSFLAENRLPLPEEKGGGRTYIGLALKKEPITKHGDY